jgi:hypothetical protein
MVGGLFTSHYPGYFKQNEDALSAAGLQVSEAPIDTGASVEANAKVIRDAVMAAAPDRQVLIGQSKGGVDITAALALYPEMKPYVRAVVSMQSPYGGTPIASDLDESTSLRPLISSAIQTVFKGSPAALSDLSYQARQTFVGSIPTPRTCRRSRSPPRGRIRSRSSSTPPSTCSAGTACPRTDWCPPRTRSSRALP